MYRVFSNMAMQEMYQNVHTQEMNENDALDYSTLVTANTKNG